MHLCKQHLPPLLEVAGPLQSPRLGITEGTLVLSMLKLLQARALPNPPAACAARLSSSLP